MKELNRKAVLDDIPAMIKICGKQLKTEMNWNDKQVAKCLKEYIEIGEAKLYFDSSGTLDTVLLS